MPFPSIFVSQTRVFSMTCSTATGTPPSIRATLEVAFVWSVLRTELQTSYHYTYQQHYRVRMSFPSIFVSQTRVYSNTCSTATGTPPSICATLEVAFVWSVFERELQTSNNYTFKPMENVRLSFPSIFVSQTRVFCNTCNTATGTPPSIRATH